MEDGPKLLPQWLRASSSSLHHRGESSADANKRGGRPIGTAVGAADSSSQQRTGVTGSDPWGLPRGGSGAAINGGAGTGAASGKGAAPADFGRGASDRGSLTERSWKPREHNGFSNPVSSRSGYVPAGLKAVGGAGAGRDERDGISLKPGGVYGIAGRSFGRAGESEGGVSSGSGRLDRGGVDGWQSARGAPGGAGGRGDDDSRSPLRVGGAAVNGGGAGTGIAAVPMKASFEADFPSLRPSSASPSPSPAASASPGPQQHQHPQHTAGALSAAATSTSAPLLGTTTSSPLLDTASSSSAAVLTPYRQTFLSSRTSSNWTSKLAEAPAAPSPGPGSNSATNTNLSLNQQIPAGVVAADDEVPAAAATPPPELAPAAPVPVVPPRPSGVWGTTASAAAVAAAADAVHNGGGGGGPPTAASRVRGDHLSTRQWKQLVPVLSSGAGKSKAGSGGVSGLSLAPGGASASAVAAGKAPKPVVPTAAMLKMTATSKRSDDTVAGPGGVGSVGGATSAGPRLLSGSSTVILSKKASQPLDRPLALTRTASASAAALPPAGTGPASASVTAATRASGSGRGEAVLVTAVSAPAQPGQGAALAAPAAVASSLPAEQPLQQPQPEARATPVAVAPMAPAAGPPPHPALQVSEEEEAFLRSLGWTGFDEEDGEDGEEPGLTEEEIAAFRAQQQRQQQAAAAAAAAGPLVSAAGAAVPKAVPVAPARRRGKPLIVAASYGSDPVSSSSDSDSGCE